MIFLDIVRLDVLHVAQGIRYCLSPVIYILQLKIRYSLRPILLFANTVVSTTKMCLDTSTLAKSIMGQRGYFCLRIFHTMIVAQGDVSINSLKNKNAMCKE
jgi:hypothetical protein